MSPARNPCGGTQRFGLTGVPSFLSAGCPEAFLRTTSRRPRPVVITCTGCAHRNARVSPWSCARGGVGRVGFRHCGHLPPSGGVGAGVLHNGHVVGCKLFRHAGSDDVCRGHRGHLHVPVRGASDVIEHRAGAVLHHTRGVAGQPLFKPSLAGAPYDAGSGSGHSYLCVHGTVLGLEEHP